ncbi:hypothetical protein ACM01_40930 [Streptomyces viridochromogenes]|uniref:Uncharacterized protein n=1 Tax=Streptomyces viridochromogenes TaxID=1938 RepID=A0A0J7YWR1_STRVR|nr:hypothetical protein ACM01_40930 [Streptomyces viridochromogenes]
MQHQSSGRGCSFGFRVRGEAEPTGDHVGGHVGEPASLHVGVGAEPDEGFVDSDAELDGEDASVQKTIRQRTR